MKELVQYLARSLVSNPDAVEINEITNDGTSVFELKVAKEDLGRIIGKQGRTARAMRNLLGATGMKFNKRFTLEILE